MAMDPGILMVIYQLKYHKLLVTIYLHSFECFHLIFLGITEKLDYLVDIGVNVIWLTPFLESPLESGGYDITDYQKVQDVFGSMEDFEKLLNTAHKKSMYKKNRTGTYAAVQ